MREETELLIVGGGPAGLATAIEARRAGLAVTVVDRQRPPIDKACGEGLMPDGLRRLGELGMTLDPERFHPFHGIRYLDTFPPEKPRGEDPVTVAEGRFPDGVRGAGIRRTYLHEALVQRAADTGVDLRWGRRVRGLIDDGRRFSGIETEDGPLHGRWLVGADGLHSRVRTWAGLDPRRAQPRRRQRFGVRRHFAVEPWSDCVEVWWTADAEAYITPVARREIGVAILWSGRKARFDDLLGAFPALRRRLEGAAVASRDRGAGPFLHRVPRPVRRNLALVGDAAGYLDALTGEGLAIAFHQALALVEAIGHGRLSSYARRCRRISAWPATLTHLLLLVERRPRLRRGVIRFLARRPGLFSRILAVHANDRHAGAVKAHRTFAARP